MPEVIEIKLEPAALLEIEEAPALECLEVGMPGVQGPAGAAAQTFTFVQTVAAESWSINHNLGRRPFITIFSVGGAEIDASVLHLSDNQTLIQFNSPTAGTARYL